jgi:hypothetical protein
LVEWKDGKEEEIIAISYLHSHDYISSLVENLFGEEKSLVLSYCMIMSLAT